MVVCRFFLEGRCRYGARCYNEHIRNDDYNDYGQNYNRSRYTWYASDSSYEHKPSAYDSPISYNKRNDYGRKQWSSAEIEPSRNRYDVLQNAKALPERNVVEEESQYVSIVQEDVVAWEKGKQWPFSCYFPFKGHPAFPRLEDISPEELRYEAYEAEKANNFSTYVSTVSEALDIVNKKWSALKNPTSDIVNLIHDIAKTKLELGTEPVSKSFSFNTANAFNSMNNESSEAPFSAMPAEQNTQSYQSVFGRNSSSSGFSLGRLVGNKSEASLFGTMQTEQSSTSSSVTNFSFTNQRQQMKFDSEHNSAITDDAKASLYTPMEQLSNSEKEEYNATMFVAGKIPTTPPAYVLCF